MEYPELKRAVRAQYERFRPSVVLIEDKASGTQLIQELIADGLHAVTRYQPQFDKIMRMHAQTAMIENGFVHLPASAAWLAQYLHEITTFPNGRHDDQVDSTAQMLDWFKQAGSGVPTTNAAGRGSRRAAGPARAPRPAARSSWHWPDEYAPSECRRRRHVRDDRGGRQVVPARGVGRVDPGDVQG